VIDEWDAVFRERKDDERDQRIYLDFLRDWFKGKDYIALAYMTGILPIKKYGKYQNDMTTFESRDDILSLLIHLGYLGYDKALGEVFIPNKEILEEFKNSTDDKIWVETFKSFRISLKLLNAIWTEVS